MTVRFAPAHRLDFALAWRYGAASRSPYRRAGSADRDHGAEERDPRRASRRSGRMPRPSPFAATGTLSGIDAAEFAARLLPRARGRSTTSRSRSSGERPRYRELTGDPHVTVTTVETHRPGLVRPRRRRDDRRAHDPVRAAVHGALARAQEAAAQRRALLLAHASRRSQRLRDLIDEAGDARRVGDRPAHQPLPDRASGPTSRTSPTRPSPR